jgi:hypothetical protein
MERKAKEMEARLAAGGTVSLTNSSKPTAAAAKRTLRATSLCRG